jgi:hypothetical protein
MNFHLPPEIPPDDPVMTVEALKHVVDELMGKIQTLVVLLDEHGLLENHTYTFPDGDVWKTKDVE